MVGGVYLVDCRLCELIIWLFGMVRGVYSVVCRLCELTIMALWYGQRYVFGGL